MRNFTVNLNCEIPKTFFTIKAAQSQDIDIEKKSKHTKEISCDIETNYNIGLIVGSSGSGKTTLTREMFGKFFIEDNILDQSKPIIEQFPDSFDYEKRQKYLSAIGLTSVPCWIRPVYTLSNGQKFRAEVAIRCAKQADPIIIDEWTSVVDRVVGKIMSYSIQKFARKFNRKIIILSCHYDVIDWLLPDFVIDCNKDEYEDRRLLRQVRTEKIKVDIRETTRKTWKYFSRYHYLSEKLPGGNTFHFGAFVGKEQIGYICFCNYVIHDHNIFHSNRIVIHPDYCGVNIGGLFADKCCEIMKKKGFKIMEKNSSLSRLNYLKKNPKWILVKTGFKTKEDRKSRRNNVRWYSWEFVG